VRVRVLTTDEELMVARQTLRLVGVETLSGEKTHA